ncbi:MAG: UDP-N-acetylglucosamine 2-epimerase (non-hydrolyzing) [Gammaproteobacteria bacterium]|nr:UDP-N-acetylglucosamine 2-epimerase (non-hydrolyzing) [Gammaproteobacteria bacterium]MDH5613530.1 UDP-N-acetylglucosamine 2-epimerase (non-hydrolyzing) [Gammaproteobacteria bacterium]
MCIVGARPNFMKIAPIMAALRSEQCHLDAFLLHTGQHYDKSMKHCFFDQLGIPVPDMDLEVGSGSHAVQTAEIMQRFEPVLDEVKPAMVLVVGDVNSTIACALVATKKGIPVVHVEAGLRSYDRDMPEEVNRVLTDQISDMHFLTEKSAHENLLREGIDDSRIHFVGNVMIDTLKNNLSKAVTPEQILSEIPNKAVFLNSKTGYGVLTLHRPSNVDNPEVLARLLETLNEISKTLPLVFPIHPRTAQKIMESGCEKYLDTDRIIQLAPLAYHEMLGLNSKARLVLTDSGGIQEETTALGVPCITLRENTERPITVDEGTNTIVGTDPVKIRAAFDNVMQTGGKAGKVPELWDGKAAVRIVEVMEKWLTDNQRH